MVATHKEDREPMVSSRKVMSLVWSVMVAIMTWLSDGHGYVRFVLSLNIFATISDHLDRQKKWNTK
jgi:hypothetical protein